MLNFDTETTRQLDIAYAGADVIRRRRASFDALDPKPGDTIIDIGCGNGLLTAELARAVGPQGHIIGVDPSDDMRAAGQAKCAEYDWVTLSDGLADKMPVEAAIADKAVSVQVYEYLPDIPSALREAHRVLKPGGRLVIADIHFDSWIWHSDDPERMQAMMTSWDEHLAERCVPAILPPLLAEAGFATDRVTPLTICDHVYKPDGLAMVMTKLMTAFAISKGHFSEDEANAWADEQEHLARAGRFFFSISQFVTTATKRVL